ncbi:hypothetical protein E2C01_015575 [Portunus trituberculatus]|uniref:Uncharacterized protein n=1 Tax=Portunus trituberculatus TaxID=210409 RepID=A0A5B7DM98_PORTR|nr:hypothetical protein [Portunus trituberculatus]
MENPSRTYLEIIQGNKTRQTNTKEQLWRNEVTQCNGEQDESGRYSVLCGVLGWCVSRPGITCGECVIGYKA